MLIPLKLKYRCQKPNSGGSKAGSQNSQPKKKTIWYHLNHPKKSGKSK